MTNSPNERLRCKRGSEVFRTTATSPQSTIFLSAAGEGSSKVARLMSLPWMILFLSWLDTVAAAGGTKRLPNACAGVAVERLKFEEAGGAETF